MNTPSPDIAHLRAIEAALGRLEAAILHAVREFEGATGLQVNEATLEHDPALNVIVELRQPTVAG